MVVATPNRTLDLWQNRIVGVVLGLTLVLLPLVFVSTGFDPFRFPKILVVRAAAVLLLTIVAARFVWSGGAWRALLHDRLFQIAAFIVGWCVLSAIVSPQPSVSWWAVGDVVAGLTLFFVARSYAAGVSSTRLFWLVLIPALVVSVVVVLQRFDLWHPLYSPEEIERLASGEKYWLARTALLGNRGDVGVYLLVPLALAVGFLPRYRMGAAVAGLAVMTGIVVSTTMTAILIAFGLAVVPLVRSSGFGPRGRWNVAAALLVIVSFASVLIAVQPDLKQRFIQHSKELRELDMISLLREREISFMVAAAMVNENPLFGVGPGRFPAGFSETVAALRLEVPELITRGTYFDMVHNDYLETAAEAGLPALAGALAFAFFYLRAISRRRAGNDGAGSAARAGMLATVAMAVAALVQFPLQIAAVYGTLAIVAGWGLGHAERSEE
jgi:O-antigen ligase